jgi:hypothetical protein
MRHLGVRLFGWLVGEMDSCYSRGQAVIVHNRIECCFLRMRVPPAVRDQEIADHHANSILQVVFLLA